jgi:hypothetical protein
LIFIDNVFNLQQSLNSVVNEGNNKLINKIKSISLLEKEKGDLNNSLKEKNEKLENKISKLHDQLFRLQVKPNLLEFESDRLLAKSDDDSDCVGEDKKSENFEYSNVANNFQIPDESVGLPDNLAGGDDSILQVSSTENTEIAISIDNDLGDKNAVTLTTDKDGDNNEENKNSSNNENISEKSSDDNDQNFADSNNNNDSDNVADVSVTDAVNSEGVLIEDY